MKILIVNTSYSFFLYLLLKKDWKDTYFLFGKMFPRAIFSNLEKKSRCRYSGYGVLKSLTRDGKGKLYQFLSYYYEIFYWHIYALWLKLTVKNLEIYGNDSMDIALPFRDKFRYLIEDGTINYIDYQAPQRTFKEKIKLFFRGMYSTYIPFGKSKNIEKIYLTGIAEIPKSIEKKVEIIDLQKLWDRKTEEEKLEILEIFGFEKDILNKIKGRDEILLTQPLSEDEIMSEDEKLDIYKEIMKNYNSENMIIKTHPREKTDYRKHFPKALILDNVFPFEILLLMGVEFKRAVTIFSTAALSIGKDCKVDFYGTKINKKLLDKFGNISLESLNSK